MADSIKGLGTDADERVRVKENLKRKFVLSKILGNSRVVKQLHRKLEKISACNVNVLISGESGTGKEPAARIIHYLSNRSGKPFVTVNCGAIPENLFENELFGHEKGAFTDASHRQLGLVKEADGGTLFLDEIGVVNPHIQIKLLRLLQYKEYCPLGSSRPRSADIRIIAATNENLGVRVKNGHFREDLYYRLNIVSVMIPPLRERKEDIPVLADYFLEKYSREYGKALESICPEAMQRLISYDWPGNIRELENKIQQTIVMASGPVISVTDLQLPKGNNYGLTEQPESFNQAKKRTIRLFERNYLVKLLTEFNGDMVGAAGKAGKSRTALWNLLARHNLHPAQFSKHS